MLLCFYEPLGVLETDPHAGPEKKHSVNACKTFFFSGTKAHHVAGTLSNIFLCANTTLIKTERAGGFHISQWS